MTTFIRVFETDIEKKYFFSKIQGFIETCVGLGMSLGPAIGGGIYGLGGYGLPFYVLGTLMLINIPICWVIIKPIQCNYKQKLFLNFGTYYKCSKNLIFSNK